MFSHLSTGHCQLKPYFGKKFVPVPCQLVLIYVNIKVERSCRIVSFQSDKHTLNTLQGYTYIYKKGLTRVRENVYIPVISCIRFRSSIPS